jgi:hypothetical protein
LNGVAGIQKEMKQIIVSTYANELLLVGIFYFTKMAKEIQLTQGQVAIVDDDMYDYLNQWKWCVNNCNGKLYAVRSLSIPKKRKIIYMHRFIVKNDSEMHTDHCNGNTLDNRKINLRICTNSQNLMNQKIHKNNKSGYKGIYFNKRTNRFDVYISIDKKQRRVGVYKDVKDAIKNYNEAAIKYYGEFANLNKID